MRKILPRRAPRAGCLAAVTISLGCLLLPSAASAQAPPAPKPLPTADPAPAVDKDNADAENKDVEILTRGPLHEAFAEQIAKDPKPLIVAAKQPPADVNEIPPEFKPEGNNVTWIPGYWFWDEERKDYIWISGVWRSIPPNRRWVPGYWQAADKGHQWVSGFWAPAAAREMEYQDTPPASLDRGPTTAAPSEEHFWIPGSWNYAKDDYRWRAGYWHPYQEDWAWVPEHYVWTPRGCIYVSGYWDYSLARRGQCYAPVYFRNGVYARAGYRYRPSYLLSGAGLLMHLFVHPHHGHYYFGDYYGSHYAELHYYHASDYYGHHRGYDPLYTYYRAHYRHHGIDYHSRMGRWNEHFTKHSDRRPPRTYAAQQQYLDRHKGRDGGRSDHLVLGRSVHDAVKRPHSGKRFERLAASGAQEADRAIRRSHDLGSQRRSSEGGPKHSGRNTPVAGRRKLTLPPASTPATASGRHRGPRPADRSRDVARSGEWRRLESSRGVRSGSSASERSRPSTANRARSARRYESRGDSSRARSSEAARAAIRRVQEAQSRRSSSPLTKPSSRSSARPSRSSARPGTSGRPSRSSSGRSVRPSRTSPRPSSGAARSGSRSSTRRSVAPSSRSRASSRSSRPSSRPSRASSSGRRSSSGASRPSRSSSSGRAHTHSSSSGRSHSHARSSGGSRRSASSRSSRGKK